MNILSLLRPKYLSTYLDENDNLKDGLQILQDSGYTAVPVIDTNGIYKGSVTEGDFLKAVLEYGIEQLETLHIRDIIKAGWNQAVKDDADIEQLVACSLNQNFVPMVDDRNCFIGIITRRSIIQAMMEKEN